MRAKKTSDYEAAADLLASVGEMVTFLVTGENTAGQVTARGWQTSDEVTEKEFQTSELVTGEEI